MWEAFERFLSNNTPGLVVRGLVAVAILLVAWYLGRLLANAAVRALKKQREGSLGSVVGRIIRAAVLFAGAMMALDQVGVDTRTVLAGAGILGLAVGFGAQSLVRDLISGFFLLLDDVLRPGDTVELNAAIGTVEDVGLRVTKVRTLNGQLLYIPNGELSTVGNYSRGWCRAIVTVGLAYEEDVEKGLQVLQEVGDAYAVENPELVLEPPEAQGVTGLNESDVGVRLMVKVKPAQQWAAERALRRRVKAAFDERGVEIPFARRVLYVRSESTEARVPDQTSSSPGDSASGAAPGRSKVG